MLKSFRNNRKLVRFPVYIENREDKKSGSSQLFGFEGIPVYWGFGFEGFYCFSKLESQPFMS